MINKQQLIDIWCKYYKKNIPVKYKPLFTENGFMRLIEGTFLTKDEYDTVMNCTHCMYGSCLLNKHYGDEPWTEELWNNLLIFFINKLLTADNGHSFYTQVIDGIICILEKDIPHIFDESHKQFYNNTDYGYFGIPHIIDIALYFNIDISEYLKEYKGFVDESSVPKFNMENWQTKFKKSKQITMLKDAVSNGVVLDFNDMPKYKSSGGIDHWETAELFYPFAENVTIIHKVIGHYIPLRKVDNGSGYIEELIDDYGWLAGFYGKTPIYKINTIQGFAFYICGSNWYGGVYCDDITIKKIKFGNPKPENNEIDNNKRLFVIYNEQTGYWQLPELHYPVKYKQYVQEVLKKQKDIIGNWNETIAYANSRTLNGDTWHFKTENYPDIKNKTEFVEKIVLNAADNAFNSLHLADKFKALGLHIKVEFENTFDFDSVIKPLNCITQEDINNYVNPKLTEDIYTIEKY